MNFEEFAAVFKKGWAKEISDKKSALLQPASLQRYFLARVDGAPVGVAGTVLKEDYGYLVGSVVLEEFRGVGAYRALIRARLQGLNRDGIPFAVTHARESTSAPILERLGFETTFRAKIYRFDAK